MKVRIYLVMIALVAIVFYGCEKDENTSSNTKKDPVITWSNPADITVGTLLSTTQLNATADVSGTFVYTPAIGASLTVGANQDLKVDFTPTNAVNYNTASKTVKINVIVKKDPVITWENPPDITVGILLSATQLNATADIAGTFVYTPAIGASLAVGANQDLKVDFTPTDLVTYNTASKTVKINIIQPTGDGGVTTSVFYPSLTYGIMTDQDGNVYKTITIGTQTWMAENLRVTKYRNGEPIPTVTDNTAWTDITTGACCTYKNTTNKDEIATYGRLYNYYAATNSRNIAPVGWHIPSDAEWTTLITYLGGESAGGKMKEAGTTHWESPNYGATNESGFTALPSGGRSSTFLGGNGDWWGSTADGAASAWYRSLYYYGAHCDRGSHVKQAGFAVRLIKD